MGDDENKGRGLPVGWGWRSDDDHGQSLYLYAPGKSGADYHAAAYTCGSWTAYPRQSDAAVAQYHDTPIGTPKSPEALAAAQREAEDALRGAGVFRGVEVDAPMAEPAPLPLAAMTGCDSHSVTPRASCAECNAIAAREDPTFTTGCPDHPRIWDRVCATCEALLCGNVAEPAPRELSTPTCPRALPCTRLDPHHEDDCTPEPNAPAAMCSGPMLPIAEAVTGAWCAVQSEPAPTDDPGDDLTELLPGLPAAVATLRGTASLQLGEPYREIAQQVALGAELLLGERATQPKALASYLDVQWSDEPMREGETVAEQAIRLLEDRREKQDIATRTVLAQGAEIATLRARVDELETLVSTENEARHRCQTEARGLRARIATLEATPPPGTVAALLAKVEEERADATREAEKGLASSYRSDQASRREAWTEAARLITATLGAPSPLDLAAPAPHPFDGVATEVLRLPPVDAADPEYYLDDIANLTNVDRSEMRDTFIRITRLGLAGMLACAPAPRPVAVGDLFIRRGPPEDEYNGVRFRVEARSSSGIMWALVPTVGPMIRLWASEDDLRSDGWERDAADGGKEPG